MTRERESPCESFRERKGFKLKKFKSKELIKNKIIFMFFYLKEGDHFY
jgi:hypothetical protein